MGENSIDATGWQRNLSAKNDFIGGFLANECPLFSGSYAPKRQKRQKEKHFFDLCFFSLITVVVREMSPRSNFPSLAPHGYPVRIAHFSPHVLFDQP
jgi:hypothetical protein